MKAWISRGIGYYTVFPPQRPAIFWLSFWKIVEATLWAQTGLRKRAWNRSKGGRAQLLKEWHNPRAYYKLIKMTDKSNSTKPWFSTCKLNDTHRGDRIVPGCYQKTKEWLVPQLLEWSSHSLAYEITQLSKTNHTTFPGHCTLWWLMPCGVCFSLNLNKSTSYLSLCLSLNSFCNDIKNPNFIRSWNQALWQSVTTEWLSVAQSHMGLSPNLR